MTDRKSTGTAAAAAAAAAASHGHKPYLSGKKSIASQTDFVVLIREDQLRFSPVSKLDANLRKDYVKALNFVNACHRFINALTEKRRKTPPPLRPCKDDPAGCSNFSLPIISNHYPLFALMLGAKLGSGGASSATGAVRNDGSQRRKSGSPTPSEVRSEGATFGDAFGALSRASDNFVQFIKRTGHQFDEIEAMASDVIPGLNVPLPQSGDFRDADLMLRQRQLSSSSEPPISQYISETFKATTGSQCSDSDSIILSDTEFENQQLQKNLIADNEARPLLGPQQILVPAKGVIVDEKNGSNFGYSLYPLFGGDTELKTNNKAIKS